MGLVGSQYCPKMLQLGPHEPCRFPTFNPKTGFNLARMNCVSSQRAARSLLEPPLVSAPSASQPARLLPLASASPCWNKPWQQGPRPQEKQSQKHWKAKTAHSANATATRNWCTARRRASFRPFHVSCTMLADGWATQRSIRSNIILRNSYKQSPRAELAQEDHKHARKAPCSSPGVLEEGGRQQWTIYLPIARLLPPAASPQATATRSTGKF